MSQDRLGRGLGALLGEYLQEPPALEVSDGRVGKTVETNGPPTLPTRSIVPNPFQPRLEFDPEELRDLAASIKESGLLQPIVVRPGSSKSVYELVAGERRLRAVKSLGWEEVPVIIKEVDNKTLLVLALVENIQRAELGPMEEALGYGALRDDFGLTQAEIAKAVGKNRSTVANMLRLLNLPISVRRLLEEGRLSMGHARALLPLEDKIRVADVAGKVVAGKWSVRDTEAAVRQVLRDGTTSPSRSNKAPPAKPADPAVIALQEQLCSSLGARVSIRWNGKGEGSLYIPFTGPRELERIFEVITGEDPADLLG